MDRKKAIIIGSGVAGMASAIRLANKGYEVDVFEKNDYPGGKLTSFRTNGYRFDAGPSLFTLPYLVDELFVISGKDPRDYFRYFEKEESCRYFWDDRTSLISWTDLDAFEKEISEKFSIAPGIIKKYLDKSSQMYHLAGKIFMEKPLHKFSTWWTRDVAKALSNLDKLDLLHTMHQANQKLLRHDQLIQLFDRYATYNGSNPYQAPAMLNMIPYLEHGIGTFLPEKGIYQITEVLFSLAEELGVRFHFKENAEEILVKSGKTYGIRTQSAEYASDLVVSNMDVMLTYRKLLQTQQAPEKILRQERSTSALIFYWGIRKQFDELGLHNILFSNDYPGEFNALVEGTVTFPDPTIYISITAKDVPSDAPEGCENWYVMVNVPYDKGQDWEKMIIDYRAAIIKKINTRFNIQIEDLIEVESFLSPPEIESRTSSFGGSLYGNSSNNRFSAFFRHANESKKIKGLYFCGGSVHPGGGIPLCLLSAKILSDLCPNPSIN